MTALQTQLPLVVHRRTALVTVDTARAVLGVDADTILARIELGAIRWAWDIGMHGRATDRVIPEYRLWARELFSQPPIIPAAPSQLTPQEVIHAVIGVERLRMTRVEVAHLLLCSRPHIMALVRVGELQADDANPLNFVTRLSLGKFLESRLLNGSVSRTPSHTGNLNSDSASLFPCLTT